MVLFKNLDNKKKVYLILLAFIALSLAFWYYSDIYSSWAQSANPYLVVVINLFINPAYIFLIFVLWEEYDLRGLFAGILISMAIDIISLSHSILHNGILPAGAQASVLYSYADTLIYKIIYPVVNGPVGVFVLYVVIPVTLVYIAFRLIRRTSSFVKIFREAI